MKRHSSKEAVIIVKKGLGFLFVIIYIVGVLLLIHILNKQNEYIPPPYLQDSTYDTNNEVKLNGIGYKIKNMKILKEKIADRNLNEGNEKDLVIDVRVSNYTRKEYLLTADQFNISNGIKNLSPKIQPQYWLNKRSDDYKNPNLMGMVKNNNVRNFKLVFNLDEQIVKSEKMLLNIRSKINSNNTISFDISKT